MLSLYLDGYSYEEIGERLECDTKTVDNALQRVKRKVAAHISGARSWSRAGRVRSASLIRRGVQAPRRIYLWPLA